MRAGTISAGADCLRESQVAPPQPIFPRLQDLTVDEATHARLGSLPAKTNSEKTRAEGKTFPLLPIITLLPQRRIHLP